MGYCSPHLLGGDGGGGGLDGGGGGGDGGDGGDGGVQAAMVPMIRVMVTPRSIPMSTSILLEMLRSNVHCCTTGP